MRRLATLIALAPAALLLASACGGGGGQPAATPTPTPTPTMKKMPPPMATPTSTPTSNGGNPADGSSGFPWWALAIAAAIGVFGGLGVGLAYWRRPPR